MEEEPQQEKKIRNRMTHWGTLHWGTYNAVLLVVLSPSVLMCIQQSKERFLSYSAQICLGHEPDWHGHCAAVCQGAD